MLLAAKFKTYVGALKRASTERQYNEVFHARGQEHRYEFRVIVKDGAYRVERTRAKESR
jgi:hypothetical protein